MKKFEMYDITTKSQVEVNVTDSGFVGIGDELDSFSGTINDGVTTQLTLVNVANACFISILNKTAGRTLQFSIDGGNTYHPVEHETDSKWVGITLSIAFTTLHIKNDSGVSISYIIYVGGEAT